jgi:hypothetical protein
LPEDKEELTISAIGLSVWAELPEIERARIVELELWKPDNLAAFYSERESHLKGKAKKMFRKQAKKGIRPPLGFADDADLFDSSE